MSAIAGEESCHALWTNTVSVLMGNGNGTFQSKVDYGTGLGPYFVAMGDLTGTGKVDLVAANSNANTVSVLSGNGDGTFQGPLNYGAGLNPRSVVAGDLSRDGEPDLAVANDSGVLVLLHGCLTNADLAIGKIETPDPVGVGGTLALVHAARGLQAVDVQVAREGAHRIAAQALDVGLDLARVVGRAAHLDLGAVHPQGVDADVEQALLDVLEVDGAALGAVGVVDAGLLR